MFADNVQKIVAREARYWARQHPTDPMLDSAEDLVQEGYLVALRLEGRAAAYLTRAIRNRFKDRLRTVAMRKRKRKALHTYLNLTTFRSASPERVLLARERLRTVQRAGIRL